MADTTLNAAISEVQATDTGMSWLRLAIAIPVGAAITFSLFILMTILIATGEKAFDEKDKGPSIDFVRVKRDERSDTLDRRLPQKLPPPVAPPPPPMQQTASLRPTNSGISMPVPEVGAGAVLGGLSLTAPTDGDIMPLVRVAPQYPQRAASQEIEGWVRLMLTIAADGSVAEAVIDDSDPKRIFDRAARRAALKWKYKPKIEDGIAVVRTGVYTTITFQLER